eukprot:TRINITY_DN44625_c1_g1_i1.p1 TRINITY_DN44625_c1_g1~~TRINITY_DN44625_c1_g1_i1.p1  ORF type:complete len:130 (-),score=4.28 TRINITY_DN44625_c1_g1_i1:480-830(-)
MAQNYCLDFYTFHCGQIQTQNQKLQGTSVPQILLWYLLVCWKPSKSYKFAWVVGVYLFKEKPVVQSWQIFLEQINLASSSKFKTWTTLGADLLQGIQQARQQIVCCGSVAALLCEI